jgi:hypothetical protein
VDWTVIPLQKTCPGTTIGSFQPGGWDEARAFMMYASLMVLFLLYLLNSGGDSSQDVGGLFNHFGYFLSLKH